MGKFKSVTTRQLMPKRSSWKRLLVCFMGILATSFAVASAYAESAEAVFPKEHEAVYQPPYINHYLARPSKYHLLAKYNYFGIQIGSISGDFEYSDTLLKQPIITDATTDFSSVSGGFYYGFGESYRNFYYGLEFQALGNGVKADATDVFSIVSLKREFRMPYTFALDFMPGVLFTDKILGFLRLGVAGSQLEVDLSLTNPLAIQLKSFNKFMPGLHLGLGADFFLTDSISIRGDYVFTSYFKVSEHITDAKTGFDYETETSARSSQLNIGVSYHF